MWPERVSFISFYMGPTPCHLSNSYLQRNQFVQLRKSFKTRVPNFTGNWTIILLLPLRCQLSFPTVTIGLHYDQRSTPHGSTCQRHHVNINHMISYPLTLLFSNGRLFLNTNSFSSRSLFEPTNQSHCADQWLCFRTVLLLHYKSESYFI